MTTAPPPARLGYFAWTMRLLRRIGFWLLVILVPLALAYWLYLEGMGWYGRRARAAAIAETDALDPRWRWEQLGEDRPKFAEGENSWPVLVEITRRQAGVRWPEPWQQTEPNQLRSATEQEALAVALEEAGDAVQLALTLATRPRGQLPWDPAFDAERPWGDAYPVHAAVSLLELEAERRALLNQPARVAVAIHCILNTGAALRDEGRPAQGRRCYQRERAVRQTVRWLGLCEPDSADLRALEAHFRAEQGENLILPGVRGERAAWHEFHEKFRTGQRSTRDYMNRFLPQGQHPAFWWLLMRGSAFSLDYLLPHDHAVTLRWANRAEAIARQPVAEQLPQWEALRDEGRAFAADHKNQLLGRFAEKAVSAITQLGLDGMADQARLACVRVALAAELYRKDQGRWPATPESLVPAYLPEVPVEPSGPLRLRADADGLNIESQSPGVVIRLLNPAQRRLPPEEQP